MTLLVLNLRVPGPGLIPSEHDLWRALRTLGPNLISYFMSFLTLGIFWVGQQTQQYCLVSTSVSIAVIVLVQLNSALAPRFGPLYRL
jgi:uncharacterized membrane protein